LFFIGLRKNWADQEGVVCGRSACAEASADEVKIARFGPILAKKAPFPQNQYFTQEFAIVKKFFYINFVIGY